MAKAFAPCAHCGIETLPTDDRRAEFYMVKNDLWDQYGAHKGYMCIGCLEARLGRELTGDDFSDVPLNNLEVADNPRWAWSYRTARLTARIAS